MLQEYKYYTECMRAIIWTNDARIIVKRPVIHTICGAI